MASYDTNDNRRASTRNIGRPKPDYGGTRVRGERTTADESSTAVIGQSFAERTRSSLLGIERHAAKRRKTIHSDGSAIDNASAKRTPKFSGSGLTARRKATITKTASRKTSQTNSKRKSAATQVTAQPESGLDKPLENHSLRASDLDDVASSSSLSDAPSSPLTPPHLQRELRSIEQRRALAASESPFSLREIDHDGTRSISDLPLGLTVQETRSRRLLGSAHLSTQADKGKGETIVSDQRVNISTKEPQPEALPTVKLLPAQPETGRPRRNREALKRYEELLQAPVSGAGINKKRTARAVLSRNPPKPCADGPDTESELAQDDDVDNFSLAKTRAALHGRRTGVSPARAAARGEKKIQRKSLMVTLQIAIRSPQATDETIEMVPEGLNDSIAVPDQEVYEQENPDCGVGTAPLSNFIEILRHEAPGPPAVPTEPAMLNPTLVAISRKMTARRALAAKPLPQGEPEVWADSRQALCETVPYFKMPQSGCHQNDRHVYAFLFDGVGHCREYMDSDVIIARAGGSMEAESTGKMVQKKDHLMSESQVQGVINDIEHKNPLVIICGNKNDGTVCKMPHRYNVLGWYKPVAVWAEKTTGKGKKTWTTIKYRFERLDSSRPAWHAPTENLLTDEERHEIGPLEARTCDFCHSTYPRIYLIDWVCLNPDCKAFWHLRDGSDAPGDRLDYNPAFLTSRTYWENEEEPYSVRPAVPDVGNTVGDNLTYINTRGICCRQCGRCSSRRLFKGWQCDNPSCDYQNFPKHIPVKVPMLHNPWETMGEGPALARNKHDKSRGVKVSVSHTLGFKIYIYTFEGVNGRFVHAVSNKKTNGAPGGPDEMFAAMQSQDDPAMDLHLERRRFAIERGAGGTKTDVDQHTPARKGAALHVPTPPPFHSTRGNRNTIDHLLEQAQQDQDPEVRQLLQEDDELADGSPEPISSSSKAIDQNLLTQQPSPPQSHEGSGASPESSAVYVEQQIQGNLAAPMASQLALSEVSALFPAVGGETIGRKVGRPSAASKPELEDGDFMTAFSMNYGMPYKFVASGASLPFTNAPWPVNACRADLNWASQSFLDPQDHTDFNELLIFAYLEGQKIEYHDDGESGLGPRIATLSLGGKAKMHMRMKMKHYVGCSKQGVFTAEKPVPGSIGGPEMYQKRLAAWNQLQHLKHTNKAQYERQRKQLPKELGLFEKRHKKAEDLVTVNLNHGDIVLMEGYEIQQYLEHKVVPEGCLRFALTCRTVLPEHLRAEELPGYEVGPDDEGMSSLRRLAAAAAAQEAGG